MAVFNFGSINIDHIYLVPHFVAPGETLSSTDYHSVLGGKGANQSIACALAGENVKHIGCVHKNDIGFVNAIRAAGVDCQHINEQSSMATGHAIIQVSESGENAIVLFSGANHALDVAHIDTVLNTATKNDWVLLQNETNAIEVIINSAFDKGIPIAFNPAPMTDAVTKLPLEKVALLIVNEIEAMQLTSTNTVAAAKIALKTHYPNTKTILTLGKEGVCYLHQDTQISVPGFTVAPLDTTAAGDTFAGYFLATYAQLDDQSVPTEALVRACAAAAISVTRSGAAPSIPHKDEVDAFLAQASL